MYKARKHMDIGLIAALAIFIADQISKHYVLDFFLHSDTPGMTVTGFFNLVMVWNHGVSFGMFAGAKLAYLWIGIASAITLTLLVWLWRCQTRWLALALGMVIGGAIGNVVDRVRFGAVFDFLDFHLMGYHWPAFNIADSAVVIGVVVLCIDSMFMEPKRRAKDV